MPLYITLMKLTEQGIKDIKNAPARIEQAEKGFDLVAGDGFVIDHVAVGAQVIGIEDMPPPVGLDIAFEVFDGTQNFDQSLVAIAGPGRAGGRFFHRH